MYVRDLRTSNNRGSPKRVRQSNVENNYDKTI